MALTNTNFRILNDEAAAILVKALDDGIQTEVVISGLEGVFVGLTRHMSRPMIYVYIASPLWQTEIDDYTETTTEPAKTLSEQASQLFSLSRDLQEIVEDVIGTEIPEFRRIKSIGNENGAGAIFACFVEPNGPVV